MKEHVVKYTALVIIFICSCIVYIITHRYVVSSSDNMAFVYDIYAQKMDTYNFKGKINDEGMKMYKISHYNKKNSMVRIYTDIDESCSGDYNMRVLVENMSDDTVLNVAFSIDARERNLSTSLIDASKQESTNIFIFDYIIQQGRSASGCFKPPKIKDAKNKDIIFSPYGVVCTFMDTPGGNELIRARFNK